LSKATNYKAKITALGCYTPPGVLTNQDLERMVETTHQWIVERTGIVERHIAPPEMATSDMAVEAARIALDHRGIIRVDQARLGVQVLDQLVVGVSIADRVIHPDIGNERVDCHRDPPWVPSRDHW